MDKQLAQLCSNSYTPVPASEWVDVKDLRFGIFDVDGMTAVVFRGSANAKNWLRNLTIIPNRSRGGHLVHKGFHTALETVWTELVHRIPKNANLITTGHSFGAAVALLAAEAFNCRAVTFGCPRVYWRFGCKPIIDHRRFACDDDPVPMTPHFLYRHLEDGIVLHDPDDEWINPDDHGIEVYITRLNGGSK